MDQTTSKALTSAEVTIILNVSVRTVMKCLHSGELQGKKIAGRWYVTEEDLKEYLKTNKAAGDDQHERIGRLMLMERMEEAGEYRDEIRALWQRLMRFSVDEDNW